MRHAVAGGSLQGFCWWPHLSCHQLAGAPFERGQAEGLTPPTASFGLNHSDPWALSHNLTPRRPLSSRMCREEMCHNQHSNISIGVGPAEAFRAAR